MSKIGQFCPPGISHKDYSLQINKVGVFFKYSIKNIFRIMLSVPSVLYVCDISIFIQSTPDATTWDLYKP